MEGTDTVERRHAATMSGALPRISLVRHGETAWTETDPDLMEWDYDSHEGRRTTEIRAERPGWRLFQDGCPGGETLDAVSMRADRVVHRLQRVGQ